MEVLKLFEPLFPSWIPIPSLYEILDIKPGLPLNLKIINWNYFLRQFLTATYNGSIATIYINAELTQANVVNYYSSLINRTKNFIGKSNWNDPFSYSYLDDLRFYNKSLTQVQINYLMYQNYTSKFLTLLESFEFT